ncbi:MAG: hypothetical protein WA710_11695, partial [Pseudolabrys sp.]
MFAAERKRATWTRRCEEKLPKALSRLSYQVKDSEKFGLGVANESEVAVIRRKNHGFHAAVQAAFVEGIARTRAFYSPVRTNRGGAAEAYLALPNPDYCDLVTSVYG